MDKPKKITNNQQFEEMLAFLENHRQAASSKYVLTNSKTATNELWQKLTLHLNSFGPPTRDEDGWKKVWADLKNKIKKKLRKEIDTVKIGTLNAFDERVVALTGMRDCPSWYQFREEEAIETALEDIVSIPKEGVEKIEEVPIPGPSKANIGKIRVPKRRKTIQQAILEELKAQEKARGQRFNDMKELLKEANEINLKRLKVEERTLKLKEAKYAASIL